MSANRSHFLQKTLMPSAFDLPHPAAADAEQPVENGSWSWRDYIGRSGDTKTDALLAGMRWSDGAVSYSFPTSVFDYQSGYPENLTDLQGLSTAQRMAVHFALNQKTYNQPRAAGGFSVEGFTNLQVDLASDGEGTLRYANTADPGTAYAYYPSYYSTGGDSFYGGSGRNPVMGNYDWATILHETGHALGLKHAHETDAFGAMPAAFDSIEYTVMSYRSYAGAPLTGYTAEDFGFSQTYMMYDIAALQHMYGADYTTNAGNTVYRWDPSSGTTTINGAAAITPGANRIFLTIWDGGGNDTYDLSAYSTGVRVDLRAGSISSLSHTQTAYLGDGHYARGNVYNALLFEGDTRSLIENAIGGSGSDTLKGNVADNRLTGNAGNDLLDGLQGNDVLNGGAGSDTIDGGSGNDTIFGGTEADSLIGGVGDDSLQGLAGDDTLIGDAGRDTLVGGAGNDVYVVDDRQDVLFEASGGGTDTVLSSVTFGLGANLENLELSGTALIQGYGNGLDNRITGNGSRNVLDGRGGHDTLIGGAGSDRYMTDGLDTIIEQAGGGTDTVYSTASLRLSAHVEQLQLMGSDKLTGTGNRMANYIQGNDGHNLLMGLDGNDLVLGGAGNDVLQGGAGDDYLAGETGSDALNGGAGADQFDFRAQDGADRIIDFTDNVDTIVLDDALWGGGQRTAGQILGMSKIVSAGLLFDFGAGDTLLVEHVTAKSVLLDDLIVI